MKSKPNIFHQWINSILLRYGYVPVDLCKKEQDISIAMKEYLNRYTYALRDHFDHFAVDLTDRFTLKYLQDDIEISNHKKQVLVAIGNLITRVFDRDMRDIRKEPSDHYFNEFDKQQFSDLGIKELFNYPLNIWIDFYSMLLSTNDLQKTLSETLDKEKNKCKNWK